MELLCCSELENPIGIETNHGILYIAIVFLLQRT